MRKLRYEFWRVIQQYTKNHLKNYMN
jgi:hypothetical protein